jgi:hypothetical protein
MSYLDYELCRKLINVKPKDLQEPLCTLVQMALVVSQNPVEWEKRFKPKEDTWIKGYCDAMNYLSKAFLDSRLNEQYLDLKIDKDRVFF